jgi:CDP-glycerol glycerophosphotransferase (TagB/SpsB family)
VLNRKAINKHIKILGLGWSKLDILINNKNKQQEYRDEVKRAFKLDNKPIILFAPTYRKHNHTSKQLPGQPEKLLSIADAIPSCNLIFCPHSMCDYADQDYKYVVNKDSTDKYKYILAADLMISDISGITIEFGVLDKPIVLLNHPNYDHYFSLNDGSGEVVDIGEIVNLSGLHDAVIRNLENPNYWGERRRYWIDKAIDYCCDGKSTPRIVDKIEELV